MIEIGTKVKLIKFNKTVNTPADCDEQENYWSLIGGNGVVVKPENSHKRVLVQFEDHHKLEKLHCHNEVENSLWILSSDLKLC